MFDNIFVSFCGPPARSKSSLLNAVDPTGKNPCLICGCPCAFPGTAFRGFEIQNPLNNIAVTFGFAASRFFSSCPQHTCLLDRNGTETFDIHSARLGFLWCWWNRRWTEKGATFSSRRLTEASVRPAGTFTQQFYRNIGGGIGGVNQQTNQCVNGSQIINSANQHIPKTFNEINKNQPNQQN